MLKKIIFLLLIFGVILSPMGVYAAGDETEGPKTLTSRPYRLPVTILPSGDVELPSGTKLPSTTTAAGALKAMTQKDKELGQELGLKPLQLGSTYITVSPDGYFSSTDYSSSLPAFADLKTALERIEGASQQPKPRPSQPPNAFSPYVSGAVRTLRPELQTPSTAPALQPSPFQLPSFAR